MGHNINPMLVNVVQVKDDEMKKKIDAKCLTGKMETSLFIYPSNDKRKILRFCNQIEYVTALNSNFKLLLNIE